MKNFSFLFIIFISLGLISCSCGSQSKSEQELDDVAITDNLPAMLNQIERAIQNKNFELTHEVLRSFPPHFDKYGRIYYDKKSGEIKSDFAKNAWFYYDQYVRKAVQVLKAEADLLLTKNDTDAESLFLEYLADFDLGVNNVNIGDYMQGQWESEENDRYRTAVTIYNDYLINVIRKSLIKGNVDLAEKLEFLVREGLSYPPHNGIKKWQYDTKAKDEARELINTYKANH